jgi:signal peptidase I
MEPTLFIGDYLIADFKYFKKNELQRGDLVLFRYPEDPTKVFVKRVIALEGEKIEIKDRQVYINGEAIPESYKVHKDTNIYDAIRDNFGPELVPSDHCFVLGDSRDNSYDSRNWGFLPVSNIKGKPLYIYWAKDKNRIGEKID